MSEHRDQSNDRVAAEAAEWFGRCRDGDLPGAERKRFAQWLAESPVHVREYLGISETWGALHGALAVPERAQPDQREFPQTTEQLLEVIRKGEATNVTPFTDASRVAPGPVPRASTVDAIHVARPRAKFAAIAACLALALMAAGVWFQERGVYRTSRGEQRSVVLSDGSIVQLNTLTTIVVHFSAERRRIELPAGEAFFRVAHDAARPFDVETPLAIVRAVGTEFSVYNRPESTRVAVVEGRVTVQKAGAGPDAAGSGIIAAGEQVSVSTSGSVERMSRSATPDTQRATAWMQRRIVLDNDRVDFAVAEFNRYNKIQMQVRDAEVADLRISGVFSADDPQALMKYLERIQHVDIVSSDGGFVLQRSAQGSSKN